MKEVQRVIRYRRSWGPSISAIFWGISLTFFVCSILVGELHNVISTKDKLSYLAIAKHLIPGNVISDRRNLNTPHSFLKGDTNNGVPVDPSKIDVPKNYCFEEGIEVNGDVVGEMEEVKNPEECSENCLGNLQCRSSMYYPLELKCVLRSTEALNNRQTGLGIYSPKVCGSREQLIHPNYIAKTYQSSVDHFGFSKRAVDQNTDGYFSVNTCTHTYEEKNPWWRVNFTKIGNYQTREVHTVTLYNRKDCCSDRLHNFDVRIGNHETCNDNALCKTNEGAVGSGEKKTLTCTKPLVGSYLCIILNEMGILTLCEVEASGYFTESIQTQYETWTPWSSCSVTCGEKGEGVITRNRPCKPGNRPIDGCELKKMFESGECVGLTPCATETPNVTKEAVDCKVSGWIPRSCDPMTKTRTWVRMVQREQKGDGEMCPEPLNMTTPCKVDESGNVDTKSNTENKKEEGLKWYWWAAIGVGAFIVICCILFFFSRRNESSEPNNYMQGYTYMQ